MSSNPKKTIQRGGNSPQQDPDEVAHVDDAVIGRAFRWSAFALLLIGIGVGSAIVYSNRKKPAGPVQMTQITVPEVATNKPTEIPKAPFTDITRQAGIQFAHNNGAGGEKLLPETMGGGVGFLDYDQDGDQDLLFINATWWPGKIPAGKSPTSCELYRNDGKGGFQNVTAGSGLDVPLFGMGCAIGDYDNDGRSDIFITCVGGNHLFHNLGDGKFQDVTATAGVGGSSTDWSTCSAWMDIDNDGDLDLFVGNYVKWSREIDFEVGFKIDGVTRAYGPPMNFGGTYPHLYRNEGNGRFTAIAEESGLHVRSVTGTPAAKSLGVAPVDLNRDGLIDFIVANDTTPNMVFTNAGGGKFKEIGALSGIAFDSYGNTRGAMGIDTGFYRNDDVLAVVIGNFANEMTALYTSQKDPCSFADSAIPDGIGPASRLLLKFGVFFFDYDLDGRLDVLSSNGHLEEEISKIQKSQHYRQPAQLFWNTGADSGATFVSVAEDKAGSDLFKPMVGRGSAYADIDGDGDEDVVITQVGGAPMLLRNDQNTGHRWLRVKLVGTKSNRDAVGATVRLKTASATLSRQVMPTRGYLSVSELPVTFGLAAMDQVDALEITWPGGKTQKVSRPSLNSTLVVREE